MTDPIVSTLSDASHAGREMHAPNGVAIAAYGTWASPITTDQLGSSGHAVASPAFVGDDIWWAEQRPQENGRAAIRRLDSDGAPIDVLPAPWNARSRVHEYGGGAWTATNDGVLVFVEFADQRLYRLDPGASDPVALTPPSDVDGTGPSVHYGDLAVGATRLEVWAVRETHGRDGIVRDLAAVPLDGSAAADPDGVRSIVGGSDFLASARVSPDGRQLAWLAWNHPQMPWDGTEVRVAELDDDGRCGPVRTVLGSTTESILQPEWDGDGHLYVLSDRSGWWNLYRIAVDGADPDGSTSAGSTSAGSTADSAAADPAPVAIAPMSMDLGGPMWTLGRRWYLPLDDGTLVAVRTLGADHLGLLDPRTGEWSDIDLGDLARVELGDVRAGRLCITAGGARSPLGVRVLDLGGTKPSVHEVRLGVDELPDVAYLPEAELVTYAGPGGRDVHAILYPPTNPDFVAPSGELAPYLTLAHGGPTGKFSAVLDLDVAYLTSRGIGVIAVNYGGSTGYGRDYRRRLNGQWGVVDVEDTVAAVNGLIASGRADPNRVAIQGGSAGGWTVLCALTTTDTFACGISYYGVTDLTTFAEDTHDFESRYLDGLIGPLPEARALYDGRSPLNNLGGLSCPVLLLQGLDDQVVPPSQAERFRDALVAKAIPHAYRAYAGESHGFRRRETLMDTAEAALSFLGQVMGFDPPDVAVLELWRP